MKEQRDIIREELLKDDFDLPITYKDKSYSYLGLIKNKFAQFKESVKKLELSILSAHEVDVALSICKTIENTLHKYYEGFPADAYSVFRKGIDLLSCYFKDLTLFDMKREEQLYRIRNSDKLINRREDLFHIPFESRSFISTQRYSIPGFPCLYLGSSIYTCLEELRSLNNTKHSYISSFKNIGGLKFIDFGYPTKVATATSSKIQGTFNQYRALKSYYLCWPLLAACSVQVKEDQGNFKPEYIISQLLLQWVRSSTEFDGIRYFTSRSRSYDKSIHLYQNYAFPVNTINEEGYCNELEKYFSLTEPVHWDYFDKEYQTEKATSEIYLGVGRKGAIDVCGVQQDYRDSYYAYIEEKLTKHVYSCLS